MQGWGLGGCVDHHMVNTRTVILILTLSYLSYSHVASIFLKPPVYYKFISYTSGPVLPDNKDRIFCCLDFEQIKPSLLFPMSSVSSLCDSLLTPIRAPVFL